MTTLLGSLEQLLNELKGPYRTRVKAAGIKPVDSITFYAYAHCPDTYEITFHRTTGKVGKDGYPEVTVHFFTVKRDSARLTQLEWLLEGMGFRMVSMWATLPAKSYYAPEA